MTRKELFKQLNNLCYTMSFEYDINNGGCCYVAAVIAEQLEKYNIPFEIAYTWNPTHYAIKVSDRYINRDDITFYNRVTLLKAGSHYLYETYNHEFWNDRYNKKWNLIVKTRIKSIFNKYGNNI